MCLTRHSTGFLRLSLSDRIVAGLRTTFAGAVFRRRKAICGGHFSSACCFLPGKDRAANNCFQALHRRLCFDAIHGMKTDPLVARGRHQVSAEGLPWLCRG